MIETHIKGYFVTEDGRVWSNRSEKFLKPWKINSGYLVVDLGGSRELVHRLVAKAYCGGVGETVNHIDGNKENNRFSNLEWCTHSENNQHAYDTGLNPSYKRFGSKNPRSKLTELEVVEIKRRSEQGESIKSIQDSFGVSYASISHIVNGRNWSHIGVDYNA